ncbi:Pumilio y domain member 6 [Elasticomyces elasticus]|nr:Pumilio y domain member 6 [Elasticomyces elasticus]
MPGMKRKEAPTPAAKPSKEFAKKLKTSSKPVKPAASPKPHKPVKTENTASKAGKPLNHARSPKSAKPVPKPNADLDEDESDTTEKEDDFYGLSSNEDADGMGDNDSASEADDESANGGVAIPNDEKMKAESKRMKKGASTDHAGNGITTDGKPVKTGTTSAEAHAAQRTLLAQRKANKPNADSIARAKKLWERLRRKSHVEASERKALVTELFDIISGNIQDFVFKHDSVRVVQCALKYANKEQRLQIAEELRGSVRTLAESRYGKFLVAKLVVEGGEKVRDLVIPEFYGHVRRLINHPEAGWILDDIYRQIATPAQKATLLREWYGAEYALFHKSKNGSGRAAHTDEKNVAESAHLEKILEQSPEKRKPLLDYLLHLINQLIQKKLTGYTMLHDALLQYFSVLAPGSSEHTELLNLLKNDSDKDESGDLLKNLAFTKSGSRVVCLALAYGSAKDRKIMLRAYKDHVEMMAWDANAHMVLVSALDVIDDTVLTSKAILLGLLGTDTSNSEQQDKLLGLMTHLTARIPILYPFAGSAKWLVPDSQQHLLAEVHGIREGTSKKDPDTRRKELVRAISAPLLSLIASRAAELLASSFGCQCVTEVLVGSEVASPAARKPALEAVAACVAGDITDEGHIAQSAAAGRMLKTLIQGGKFDPTTKTASPASPPLEFASVLYPHIKQHIARWACSPSSFVVVALLESSSFDESGKREIVSALKKQKGELYEAAGPEPVGLKEKEPARKEARLKGNAGARILLEKIA